MKLTIDERSIPRLRPPKKESVEKRIYHIQTSLMEKCLEEEEDEDKKKCWKAKRVPMTGDKEPLWDQPGGEK